MTLKELIEIVESTAPEAMNAELITIDNKNEKMPPLDFQMIVEGEDGQPGIVLA